MKLTSPVFGQLDKIPDKYTCDGANVNPPLVIREVPQEAKSLVLIIDDPDASIGIWDHWLVWNIKPTTTLIEEDSVPEGSVQGLNGFVKTGYGGPCLTAGRHRYFFKLFALDKNLDLKPGTMKAELEEAMIGHILAYAEMIGLYER